MPLPWLDWNWSWVLWMLASWPQIHVNNVNVSFAIPTLSLSLNRFPLCRQNFWPTSKSDWKLFLRTIMKREKRSSTTIVTVTATAAHAEHKRRRTLCRVSCRSLLINNVLIYTIVVPEDQKCLTVWQFTAVQMKDERFTKFALKITLVHRTPCGRKYGGHFGSGTSCQTTCHILHDYTFDLAAISCSLSNLRWTQRLHINAMTRTSCQLRIYGI